MRRISLPAIATVVAGLVWSTAVISENTDLNATAMIGNRVVAVNLGETLADGDEIGEIDDIVVDPGGDMTLVIIGVGGFLGIGEKAVAVPLDQIRPVIDSSGLRVFVLNTTPDELHNLPLYEPGN